MTKPEIRLVPNNQKNVSVRVGNKTYPISEEEDKELIDKANKYKKSLSKKKSYSTKLFVWSLDNYL